MFIGLLLTAAVGFYVSGNIDLVLAIATNQFCCLDFLPRS